MFDSNEFSWKDNQFNKDDWMELYGDIKEEVHPNAPGERGIPVQDNGFIDTAHA